MGVNTANGPGKRLLSFPLISVEESHTRYMAKAEIDSLESLQKREMRNVMFKRELQADLNLGMVYLKS